MEKLVLVITPAEKTRLDLTSKEKAAADENALARMGFTKEEIALVKMFYVRPTPAGVSDAVRYAVWALKYLPRADADGTISPTTYYQATRITHAADSSGLPHWAQAAFRAHGDEGRPPEPSLFGILRKALAWCSRFEEQNPLQEWPHERIQQSIARRTRHDSPVRRATDPPHKSVTVEIPDQIPSPEVKVARDQLSLFDE